MNNLASTIRQSTADVQAHCSEKIDSAVLLGSGLSQLRLPGFELITEIPYAEISGLPLSTAPTHKGSLSIMSNGQSNIALCAGRHHLYEGYSAQQVSVLPYTLRALGARKFIVTNAAGSLNPTFEPASVMLISDHINATGQNPLIGQSMNFNDAESESLGSAFPDMSDAYSRELQQHALSVAKQNSIDLQRGIYVGVQGPSLETSAERRMMRAWGGDAVGMSTVTEVIAAVHCGMQVLGLSAITNMALGDEAQQADSIESIIRNAAQAGKQIETLLQGLL